jgi:hypothetical protein
MSAKPTPGPFQILVQECYVGPKNKGWVIHGEAQGRYIRPGTVLLDGAGGEVTVFGHCRMRMVVGPSKWGWVVDREIPVGAVLREPSELEVGQ